MSSVSALDPRRTPRADPPPPDSLALLRLATRSATLLEVLGRDWPYPGRRSLRLRHVDVLRVFPRRDGRFTLLYEMTFEGAGGTRVEQFFGRIGEGDPVAAAATARWRLAKRRRRQISPSSDEDAVWALPALGMVLRRMALDERLPGLKLLHSPARATAVFSRYLGPDGDGYRAVAAELLGHRLGKRAVVRFRFEAGGRPPRSIVAKFYSPHGRRGWAAMTAMQALWTGGFGAAAPVRVPRPMAYVGEWGALLMEDVPGRPLDELAAEAAAAGAVLAGRALARLHAAPLATPERHDVPDELALLERWVGLTTKVLPALAGVLEPALARVATDLGATVCARPALIHRDYHDKQVLIAPAATTIIDYDTLALGDPALDVANYLAHGDLARLSGVSQGGIEAAFLAGYDAGGEGFASRVAAYRRATHLRLACLYAFSDRTRNAALRLLELDESGAA